MSKTAYTLQEFLGSPSSFNSINIQGKNLTDNDCVKLAVALKGNNTVTYIYLHNNQIGNQGTAALADSFKGNNIITRINLGQNQIGNLGAAALAEGLKGNNTLQELHLEGNQIGDQGAASLADFLKSNDAVTFLLHSNQIGDQGIAALSEAFKISKANAYFYLHNNQIGDQGVVSLVEVLRVNKFISGLSINDNQISDQGAAALADFLKNNNKIGYLQLQNNQISNKGLALLKASWQREIHNLHLEGQNPAAREAVEKLAQQKAEQEAAEKAELKAKLQEAEEKLAAMAKAKQAKQEAKAAQIEAERLAQVAKLKEAEESKAAKEAAKLKALEEEKVKAYAPETDLNITKIFAEGVPMEGGLVDHNQTIRQVSELIRDGNDRLQEHTKKGILLLGDTGAGKSTLAHLLSGRKLQAIVDDKTGKLIVDAMQPLADIVIGHIPASETKIPNKCLADGTVIWDCPGFNDTKPVQEIANIFYTKKLFEITDEMKFVLVVPESDLSEKKGNNFLETLSSFMKVFSNIEATSGSVSLVITQVPSYKKLQHIKNTIEDILIHNESVTMEQRILVNKLVNNSSLHLFHKPQCEGEFNAVNPLGAIENSTWYTKAALTWPI